MKRRILTTQKILAVSFLAAGCATQATPEAQSASAPINEAPATVVVAPPTAQPLVQPVSVSETSTPAAATPEPAESPDKAAYALRNELETSTRADVMKRIAHFRPLCDKDGFPVVGNAVRKGQPEYTTSKFCAEIRATKS